MGSLQRGRQIQARYGIPVGWQVSFRLLICCIAETCSINVLLLGNNALNFNRVKTLEHVFGQYPTVSQKQCKIETLARTTSRCQRAYIIPLWFFRCLILRSLNRCQPNLDTYSFMTAIWKFWSELPWAFTLPPQAGGQNPLFGTDFELWPNISLQRNMIWTIGKKLVNLQGLPKFGECSSRKGWERLAGCCPPSKFLHWETMPALQHGRYITDSRQTMTRVM